MSCKHTNQYRSYSAKIRETEYIVDRTIYIFLVLLLNMASKTSGFSLKVKHSVQGHMHSLQTYTQNIFVLYLNYGFVDFGRKYKFFKGVPV